MRGSVSALTLFEVALLQICQLEHMHTVASLLEAIMPRGAAGPAATEKKKAELAPASIPEHHLTSSSSPAGPAGASVVPAPHFSSGTPSAATRRLAAMAATIGGDSEAAATITQKKNADTGGTTPEVANPPTARLSETTAVATTAVTTAPAAVAGSVLADNSVADRPLAAVERDTAAISDKSHAAVAPAAVASTATTTPTSANTAATTIVPSTNGHAEPPAAGPPLPKGSPQAMAEWQRALKQIDGMLADVAAMAAVVEPVGSSAWNILFPPGANKPREFCEVPQRKAELTAAVEQTVGRSIQLTFAVIPGEVARPVSTTSNAALRVKRQRELADHPFIKCICETLEGEITRVDLGNYKN
jgi:hypothetical protein